MDEFTKTSRIPSPLPVIEAVFGVHIHGSLIFLCVVRNCDSQKKIKTRSKNFGRNCRFFFIFFLKSCRFLEFSFDITGTGRFNSSTCRK
jgi:hypothetical protein